MNEFMYYVLWANLKTARKHAQRGGEVVMC